MLTSTITTLLAASACAMPQARSTDANALDTRSALDALLVPRDRFDSVVRALRRHKQTTCLLTVKSRMATNAAGVAPDSPVVRLAKIRVAEASQVSAPVGKAVVEW